MHDEDTGRPIGRIIEWDGEPFAVLIELPEGDYLVPPIVLDEEGKLVEGRELAAAVVETGIAIEHPVMTAATAGDLAEVDQRMARLSEQLGVRIV
jgi:hypothetical protein